MYNTGDGAGVSEAASRAGLIAVIHIVPLLIAYQLGFVPNALGLSINVLLKEYQALAVMATMREDGPS